VKTSAFFAGVFCLFLTTGVANSADAQRARPTVRLVLLGQSLIEHDPRGLLEKPIASIRPILERGDVVFTNFEGAVKTDGCTCKPTRGDVFQHGGGPEVFDFLRFANVSLLSLANNHAWDYGNDGVVSTLDAARSHGMHTAGTGRTLAEATAPAIIVVKGVRIALLAMATVRLSDSAMATSTMPGVNLLRLDNEADWTRNIAAITEAKKHADVVIVYHHFQTVGTPAWQQRWAHAAIDAGATIYVAHGEPMLFGAESYRGRPILYGLGNFIFQTRTEVGHYPREVWQSVVAEITVGRDTVSSVTMTPIEVAEGVQGPLFLETRGFPSLAKPEVAQEIIKRLTVLSANIGTQLVRTGDTVTLQILH
jgi:poly-gamma-glutamate capsule biosynthesis protein CapA/YwtB (metallophosphatase superfamily)